MELKPLCLFLVILVIYKNNDYIYAGVSLSMEEDMELERELKILNKVPVKTITMDEGDVIDCIDMYKQPAFDHPLLTNHTIQLKPSSMPNGLTQKINTLMIKHGCPEGTVPIERITMEDLIRTKSLIKYPSITNIDIKNSARVQHRVGLHVKKRVGPLHGATGSVGVFNLTNVAAYSLNNIWVQSGFGANLSFLAAGWAVSPELYGDGLTRLFTYWTNAYKSGCFNLYCSGFILVNKDTGVNVPIRRLGLKNLGFGIELPILIFQDRQSKNWWLMLLKENIAIGYWPNAIFTTLQSGADLVAWGGITKPGADGISPPMGSGLDPRPAGLDRRYWDKGHFSSVGYVTSIDEVTRPLPNEGVVMNDTSGCYHFLNEPVGKYEFAYGGPGGKCG